MKKTRVLVIFLALVSAAASFMPAQLAQATDAHTYNAGRIMDDAIFTNKDSMSAGDIQAFLNSKVPSCGIAVCLKNYRQNVQTGADNYGGAPNPAGSMSAAEIIKTYSDQFSINPQVILATLQKENGIVTSTAPSLQRFQQAMGYGCPDNRTPGAPACNPASGSFSAQIYEGSRHFRGYFDAPAGWWVTFRPGANTILFNPSSSCGSSVVNIENRATAALYTYTPYQPNQAALDAGYGMGNGCSSYGNRNFFLFFSDWFGPTTGTILLQSPSSPAVYLLSGSTRYGVPSYDVLRAYGLAGLKVTPVTDQFLNSLTDGGILGTLFTKEGENAVYLADNGYRFGIASYNQCTDWGYPSCLSSSTKALAAPVFNMILNGGDLKSLMLNGNSVFAMINGQKWPFMTNKALTDKGYGPANISPMTNPINTSQPIGYSIPENNTYIKIGNDPVIYAYTNDTFYSINSYDVFRSILPPGAPVYHDTGSLYVSNPPQPPRSVPAFITTENGAKTYMLGGGGKYNISAVASDWPTASAFNEISPILEKKMTDADITPNTTFQLPSGMLFQVKNRTIKQFYSVHDFYASPFLKQPAILSDDLINGFSQGDPIIAAGSGSLYKVTTPSSYDMIFTLNSDNTACSLANLEQLGGFGLEANNVQRLAINPTYKGILRSIAKSTDGQYYLVANQAKTVLPGSVITAWGIDTSKACGFTDQYISKFSTRSNAVSFVRLPNGTIFYGKDGTNHQILTYSTFLNLGGNTSNTLDVPYDFLDYTAPGNSLQ